MFSHFPRIFLLSVCLCLPALSSASPCSAELNHIAGDINHYGDAIKTMNLSWMHIRALKNDFPEPMQLTNAAGQPEYQFHCDENNYLKVTTDRSGNVLEISGQYSSEEGGGMIELALPPHVSAAAPAPSVDVGKQKADAQARAELKAQQKAAAVEARQESKAELAARAAAKKNAELEARVKAVEREKAELEAKIQLETREKLAAEAKVKAESATASRSQHEADMKAKAEASEVAKQAARIKLEAEMQAKAEARAQAEAAAKEKQTAALQAKKAAHEAAKAKLDAEIKAKAAAAAEAKARSDADFKAKLEARSAARAAAKAKQTAEMKAQAATAADTKLKHEIELKAKAQVEADAKLKHAEELKAEADAQAAEKIKAAAVSAAAQVKAKAKTAAQANQEISAKAKDTAAAQAKEQVEQDAAAKTSAAASVKLPAANSNTASQAKIDADIQSKADAAVRAAAAAVAKADADEKAKEKLMPVAPVVTPVPSQVAIPAVSAPIATPTPTVSHALKLLAPNASSELKPVAAPAPMPSAPVVSAPMPAASSPVEQPSAAATTVASASQAAAVPPPAPTSAAPAPVKNKVDAFIAKALQNSMKDFSGWFNVDITDNDGLMNDAVQRIQKYYSSLRGCVPGSYTYPKINPSLAMVGNPSLFVLAHSVLSKDKNGTCNVKTSVEVNNTPNTVVCSFSHSDLAFFSDNQAKAFLTNKQINIDSDPKLAQILQKCKSDPALITSASESASQFFSNLKSCTPGSFKTLRPDPIAKVNHTPGPPYYITQESVIVGLQDNKCQVKNITSISGIEIKTKCLYSQASLNYLSDVLAKRLIGNYSLATGSQPEPPTPAEVAGISKVNSECSQES